MSPSPRAVAVAVLLALSLLVAPWGLVVLAAVVAAAALGVDAWSARRPVVVERTVPARMARGVPARLSISVSGVGGRSVVVRQPRLPDVRLEPSVAAGDLEAAIVASRRGRHVLAPVAVRVTGPLGLGRWDQEHCGPSVIEVVPDLPAARRIATAVRQGRFRDPGLSRRGPIGLGTDFDQVRDYQPDDDVRHINWVTTVRQGRPMTNQYREDTERDVIVMVDRGRLMAAPLLGPDGRHDRTRLDTAVDAATALAAVADAVGDRCGLVVFDDEVRARVSPRRASGDAVVATLHDVEPRSVDSDPERAFRTLSATKRALVVVLTDLVDEAAAAALLDAVPVLVRRHAVVVASSSDSDLERLAAVSSADPGDLRARVASEVLRSRDRVSAVLRHRGATVVEAPVERLSAAVVAAYLEAKASARL